MATKANTYRMLRIIINLRRKMLSVVIVFWPIWLSYSFTNFIQVIINFLYQGIFFTKILSQTGPVVFKTVNRWLQTGKDGHKMHQQGLIDFFLAPVIKNITTWHFVYKNGKFIGFDWHINSINHTSWLTKSVRRLKFLK